MANIMSPACLYRLMVLTILAVVGASTAALLFFSPFEDLYWVIPLAFLVNMLIFWVILRQLILKTFVFLYA